MLATLELQSFGLSILGGQSAEEADVLAIEAVVDSDEIRPEHVVEVFTTFSPI